MLHEPITSEFITILSIDYFEIVVATHLCNVIFFFVIISFLVVCYYMTTTKWFVVMFFLFFYLLLSNKLEENCTHYQI